MVSKGRANVEFGTGVCYGSLGVAIVEVENPTSAPVVAKWAWAPWDSEMPEVRANVIKRLFTKYDFRQDSVVVCLAQNAVLMRIMHLPAASSSETSAMADMQAKKALPLLSEELEVDFEPLDDDGAEQSVVLLVARRRVPEEILSMFSAAGIKPGKIIPESHAIMAPFSEKNPSEDGLALLHADGERIFIVLSRRGKIVFARVIHSADGDSGIDDERIAAEWRKCSDVEESFSLHATKILLAGDAAQSEFLKVKLQREAGFPVDIFDPFSTAARFGVLTKNPEGRSCAVLALGAALSAGVNTVNLIPRQEKLRRAKIRRRREMLRAAAACFIFYLSIGAIAFQQTHEMGRRLRELNERLLVLKPTANEAEKMLQEIKAARDRHDSRGGVLNTLSKAYQSMPAEISLSSLDYKMGDRLSLQGTARSMAAATSWVQRLARSGMFKSVELESISARADSDENLVDFVVRADLTTGETKIALNG